MEMHFHRFGKWEDVEIREIVQSAPMIPIVGIYQVIRQQRRCSICNLVKTRYSA